MRLSELKQGQKGIIVKVHGHGGFRKRIIEMGFIRGKHIEVLLNAPLHDPVKYGIMGYEVSLRRQEAQLIEVVAEGDETVLETAADTRLRIEDHSDDLLHHVAMRQSRTINVALIGNPNCGKTSLFNHASGAHAHVGNYSGVTVDATTAHATMYGYEFRLIDLPGTYSLSCYSPEELYVRKYLTEEMPDVVINVVDATNLERNLYLTTQLLDMNVKMVCAFNMYDQFSQRGDSVSLDTLQTLLGMPIVETSFKTGQGVKELFKAVIQVYEDKNRYARHFHINYGHEIEHGISGIQRYLKSLSEVTSYYSTRYLAIKILENDTEALRYVADHFDADTAASISQARQRAATRVEEETGSDAETAIMDAKYGFINGALAEAGYATGTSNDIYRTTRLLDRILSHRIVGFPIFFIILYVMFQVTFSLGQYPMDWIESLVGWLGRFIESALPPGPLCSLLVDGVIGGVGSVIVFLPQILILYFFISLMEDSGYMARAAFIMDRLMHRIGLHGKSFIPLIMGFGCNVPAIMATRTIESRRSRLITMMVLPFISCSARLPIYIMIVGTFFAAAWRSAVLLSLYAAGILTAILVSRIMATFVIKRDDTPFVMELPPYRWPTAKAIGRHTWEKGKEYLKKMGGIILAASIVVWALGYFPHDDTLSDAAQQEQSYIGRIGKAVSPFFAPQGFNWKLDVSLIAGIGAKEIVASTIGVLYSGDASFADDTEFDADGGKYSRLQQQMAAEGITPAIAYSYLIFVLLYFPCLATIVAIKNETGSWRWAAAAAVYTTLIAWVVSALVHLIAVSL